MSCTLCDLPTPDPPHTDPAVDGRYCCQGCLRVAQTLDAVDDGEADAMRDRVRRRTTGDGERERETAGPPDDAVETVLQVDGMHCATCEAFLEARAERGGDVHEATASYAAGVVTVHHDASLAPESVAERLDGTGYRASLLGRDAGDPPHSDGADASACGSSSELSGRLLVGGFFGMMTMLWYVLFLYPTYLGFDRLVLFSLDGSAGTYLLVNVWVMATVVLLYTGFPILRGAYVSLRARSLNMDLLVATASVAAYLFSLATLATGGREVYFDVSVVVILAVTVGGAYEGRIRRRATDAIDALREAHANVARVRTTAGTELVSIADLDRGDEVLVRAGERVPVDGEVIEGTAAVDEALLTGESLPVRREAGDRVVGGSVLRSGGLVLRVDDAENTLDRLVRLQWSVRATRSGATRLADRLAGVFVPVAALLAVVAAGVHLALGASAGAALLTGLAVLVVSCPCALGLATPLAVSSGVRDALRAGVVVTGGEVFERAADTDVIAFDKTGTLTTGEMRLSAVVADGETGADASATDEELRADVLSRAAAVEQFADHPVAEAVLAAADPPEASVEAVDQHPGLGVSAVVDGERVVVGRERLFVDHDWAVPDALGERAADERENGAVAALVGWDGAARGLLVAADEPRPGWEEVVSELTERARIVVITGDGAAAARPFAAHPAIDEVFTDVRPEAKVALVERLREEGTTVMVGDGVNDAPALAAADLGIALSSGAALAADAADAVITTGDLSTVRKTFDVTAGTRRRIRENLAWAFVYNALALPVAALGLLNPAVASVAMATSSLLVVGNSARRVAGVENEASEPRDGDEPGPDGTRQRPGSELPPNGRSATEPSDRGTVQ